MNNEKNLQIFQFDIDTEILAKVEIKDHLIKWTIDIIENPERHFKAEDDRRFSIYNEQYQSFLSFLVNPWLEIIPKDIHKEIAELIRKNYTVKDLEKSYKEMVSARNHYWTPLLEKLIVERGSKESSEEYYDIGRGILIIRVDFIDPFDRTNTRELVSYEDVVKTPTHYPKEVQDYVATLLNK